VALSVGIVGAGAIGTYVGGRLGVGGAEVVLVGRPWVAERIERGLVLSRWGALGDSAAGVPFPADRVRLETEVGAVCGCDVVFVATKAKDTASVGRSLAAAGLPTDTPVGSLQNGLRNTLALREGLAENPLWPGMVSFNVVWADDGLRLHQGTSGPIVLPREAEAVVSAMRAGGLEAETHLDLPGVQWMKLLLNLNNAVNALSGLPLREMLSDRRYRRAMAAVVDEAREVLRAAEIRPRGVGRLQPALISPVLRLPDLLFFRVAKAMILIDPEARSSMAEDLRSGRPTEVDELNGEIVRTAASVGRTAPRNALLVRLVREAERAPRTWSAPELLAAVSAAA
jgi:2-dehydropantoate 2-reductase